MNGQPDGRFVRYCPLDPVPFVERDIDVIARHHMDGLYVTLEKQLGLAHQDYDPFVVVLVLPASFETCLTLGDDPLNTK